MKTKIHDIVIPFTDSTPDSTPEKVSVCVSEIDSLGRQMPFVRINIKLKPDEIAALGNIQKRAKRILKKRTDAAVSLITTRPDTPVSLDTETAGEDDA